MGTKIRPASRILQTIGRDLIKDQYAAVVELVKNAYDADSKLVQVVLEYSEPKQSLSIKVIDFGHGMSYDTIVNNWMVPATDYKLKKNTSPNGRVLQGRKGIGRFSATILGELINLESIHDGEMTSLILDMEALNNVTFLDEYEIDIGRIKSSMPNGTVIEIEQNNISREQLRFLWDTDALQKLQHELTTLISPVDVYPSPENYDRPIDVDEFEIKLIFKDFPIGDTENRDSDITLTPYPILELYDYRVYGTVDSNGKAKLKYVNQNVPDLPDEEITIRIHTKGKYPGKLYIDLMVFDRDPESIQKLIERGLKNPETGENLGRNQTKDILNSTYGVGVYRQKFRLKPYGDQSFDWLELDKARVQNPSHKIGHNQVVGFVFIQQEEKSNLIEKSARDGLVDNAHYKGLQEVLNQLMRELEVRRTRYREKTLQGGRHRTIEQEVDLLFDFSGMHTSLSNTLKGLDVPEQVMLDLEKSINVVINTEQRKKTAYSEKIKETIATYQNHAMLGRLTHVLIHEGRKPIKDLMETIPRIVGWAKKLSKDPNNELESKLEDRSEQVKTSTTSLSNLFKRIEPLARPKRTKPKPINLRKTIESSLAIFQTDLEEKNIISSIAMEGDISVIANEIDLMTIFTNLIENSIFWLAFSELENKEIKIDVSADNQEVIISYLDTGAGFNGDNLELMFEPGYSTKPKGTGLGLALSGEAALRSNGEIRAIKNRAGAEFLITFTEGMVTNGNN